MLGSDILSNNATSLFTPQKTTIYTLNYNDDAGCATSVQFEIYIPIQLDPLIQELVISFTLVFLDISISGI